MNRIGNQRDGSYRGDASDSLLVEGYRGLFLQTGAGERAAVQHLLGQRLGAEAGLLLFETLDGFVSSLQRCATCPMRACPAGTPGINRDEALVFALLAALQHGDDEAAATCVSALICPSKAPEILCAAAPLAMALKLAGLVLAPICATHVRDVLCRPVTATAVHYPNYH